MAAKTSAIGRPPKRHVATLRPTDTVLDDLFAELDAVQKRLVAAQDEEAAKLPPIDWTTAQQELAEERARLLITGGNAIDQIMRIAELGVGVARQIATVETTKRMADAQPIRAITPPPIVDPDDDGTVDDDPPGVWPDDDDSADTEPLRVIHERATAETAETQKVWVPTWRANAVRVGGWWRRVWAPIKTGLLTPAPLLWGGA